MRWRLLWGLTVAGLALSLLFTLQGNRISTNLFALLPEQHDLNLPQQVIDDYSEKLSRQHLFLVGAATAQQAREAADKLFPLLEDSHVFRRIQLRLDEQQLKSVYTAYQPYRFGLLSEQDRKLLQTLGSEALLEKILRSFISPLAGVDSAALQQDPFSLFRDFLGSLPVGNPRAYMDDGYTLFDKNGKSYVLMSAELDGSAFEPELQERFARLEKSVASVLSDKVELINFGVIRYALQNRRIAEREISIIGTGSIIGIILIFILVFRRIRIIGIVLLPVMIGVVCAVALTLLLLGQLHLVSLVFGASLIGVSIDYALHYCCSNSNLTQCRNGQQALAEVRPALTMGLISSALGFVTLSIADFPALRQMAVMAIAGLTGAYFTVVFWLPVLIHKPLRVTPQIVHWSQRLSDLVRTVRPIPLWLVVAITAVLAGVNLSMDRAEDNIKLMQARLAGLDQVDQKLKSIIGEIPNSQFFLVSADSADGLLMAEQKLRKRLAALQFANTRVMAVSQWVPDSASQQKNYQLLRDSLQDSQKLDTGLTAMGLPIQSISTYRQSVLASKPQWMTVEEFLQTPAGQFQSTLWPGKIGQRYYSIVSLYGFTELAALKAIVSGWSDVQLVDRSAQVTALLQKYREIVQTLFPFVLLAIFAVLLWRFGLQDAIRVVCAPTLAALLSFLCMNLLIGSYNLFSIFGLIITVAIAIDYAVFIREARTVQPSTYLAITLAGLTTILALGLLSLSQTPALSSFGLSLLLGVVFSYVLIPFIVRPAERGRT